MALIYVPHCREKYLKTKREAWRKKENLKTKGALGDKGKSWRQSKNLEAK